MVFKKGMHHSTEFKKGHKFSEETLKKISETRKRLFREGKLKSPNWILKKGRIPWNKGLPRKELEKHYKNGWNFKKGHEVPLKWRLKTSQLFKGKKLKPLSEETKRKIGLANKGRKFDSIQYPNFGMRGKNMSEETKLKDRLAHLGKVTWNKNIPMSEEQKQILSKFRKGKHLSEETKKKLSEINKARYVKKPELRVKFHNLMIGNTRGFKKGQKFTPEFIEKLSKAFKKKWQDPVYKTKQLDAMYKGLKKRPTSLEVQFDNDFILKYTMPLKYTGDGKDGFKIGFRYPDYIKTNGENVCVEVRAKAPTQFWNKMSPEEYEKKTIEHYAKSGWKCIVLFANKISNKKYKFDKSDEQILKELGDE